MRSALLILVACGSRKEPPPAPVVPQEAALPDAAIDAPVDAAIDAPLVPGLEMRMLEGPYKSIAEYCKDKPHIDDEGYETHCEQEALWTGKQRLSPAAPFDEARLVVVEGLDPHCELAIRTGTAWFVLHDALRCLGSRSKTSQEMKVTKLASDDGRLVLQTTYDQSTQEYSPENFGVWHFEIRILCGAGPSGRPTCTRELPVRGRHESHATNEKTRKAEFALDYKLEPEQITISGETSALEAFIIEPLAAGTYAFRFP